jgi:hypothetical protein
MYRGAFGRHDQIRFAAYLEKVQKGEAKIHASTLYPYDIIKGYIGDGYSFCNRYGTYNVREDATLEAQWKALPNYVTEPCNAIVVADVSGSMTSDNCRPLATSIGLAIYFAERNTGPYHGLWMSFSSDCKVQKLRGETLAQKLTDLDRAHWEMDTNLESAFMNILSIAIKNRISPDEMVKSIVVVSDMEINHCTGSWSFYDEMRNRYEQAGYQIPNVVFWNVESRHDVFHADATRKGVQLCSGQSPSTFKVLMASIGMSPDEMMMQVLGSERYACVKISNA